jgi:copper(I)-binding protein
MRRRWAPGWCALLLVATAVAQSASSVRIKDAWIRWLPGDVPGGGYLTLVNQGDAPIRLIGAVSDEYGSISLHQSREQAGVSMMMPVQGITVKPHATLQLAAEGYHLMLSDPKKVLHPGDHAVLTLTFADGERISVPFELRSPDMLMGK